jgi:glyoxylase-like metal-dependent hydrolase (beta-lactamase superfamily II)
MKSDEPDDPLARSVLPLFDDGLLKLIEGQTQIGRGVDAIHTPGHTPGHMSLIISSGKERALLIGDIVGSPMQVTESEFFYTPDSDSELGRKTRNDMLDLAEKENITVLGSHLSYPGWGTIIRWEGRRYFQPLKNIKDRSIN